MFQPFRSPRLMGLLMKYDSAETIQLPANFANPRQ
jgi:hypothetical protein